MASSSIQGVIRTHIERAMELIPGCRLQLVRRPSGENGITVMAATSTSDEQSVYRLVLGSIEELVDIDIAAMFHGGAGAERLQETLYLVCSHGIRDQCCAREGIPVFNAMEKERPGMVWQTTHLGGHRFAATLVALPMGIQFGRVSVDDAKELTSSLDDRRIYRLDRYRGTTEGTRNIQVAEAHLRAMGPHLHLDAVRYQSSTDTEAVFDVKGTTVRVGVRSRIDHRPRPFSCGDERMRTPPVHEATVSSR
jgi:hypothetical protein